MRETTLREVWTRFESEVLPDDIPLRDRKILKSVFFAGGIAVLDLQTKFAKLPEADGQRGLCSLFEECNEYQQEITE